MKIQRINIDTSVYGGYFDIEFEDFTRPLFEKIQQGEFTILFSAVTQEELEFAPDPVKELVTDLRADQTEFFELNGESVELAQE